MARRLIISGIPQRSKEIVQQCTVLSHSGPKTTRFSLVSLLPRQPQGSQCLVLRSHWNGLCSRMWPCKLSSLFFHITRCHASGHGLSKWRILKINNRMDVYFKCGLFQKFVKQLCLFLSFYAFFKLDAVNVIVILLCVNPCFCIQRSMYIFYTPTLSFFCRTY